MPENPYRSPNQVAVEEKPNSKRLLFFSILWILFFLIPSIVLAIVKIGHIAPFLGGERPSGDTILSRCSLILRIPIEPLLLVSLLGCLLSTLLLPIKKFRWKFVILVAWFPLVVLQDVVLGIVLAILGETWADV